MSHPRRTSHQRLAGRRDALWVAVVLALASAPARANPIPDEVVREMNARPARWLAHPTPEDERGLVDEFGWYGLSRVLLAPETVDLLDRNFDRFAPFLVAAQRPPNGPKANLQRWYRERADDAQAEAMKSALREWLIADVIELPHHGGLTVVGGAHALEREIWSDRLLAADALGDWRDEKAVTALRSLLSRASEPDTILVTAIRRILHPTTPDFIELDREGSITIGRPTEDLDSMVVLSADQITADSTTWKVDHEGIEHIWAALRTAREAQQPHRNGPTMESGSVCPKLITVHFRDGETGSIEYSRDIWRYRESGRPGFSPEIMDTALMTTLLTELSRAGIAPAAPRFVEESVTLQIDPGQLRVTGLYDFEGRPPQGRAWIQYPISTDGGLGEPHIDLLRFHVANDLNRLLPVSLEQHGATCLIALTSGDAKAYQLEIHYHQALEGRSAKYLITTARAWGRPLHRAWFQVIIDSTLGEPHFALPFREVRESPGYRRFLFEAKPFRPDADLVVTW